MLKGDPMRKILILALSVSCLTIAGLAGAQAAGGYEKKDAQSSNPNAPDAQMAGKPTMNPDGTPVTNPNVDPMKPKMGAMQATPMQGSGTNTNAN